MEFSRDLPHPIPLPWELQALRGTQQGEGLLWPPVGEQGTMRTHQSLLCFSAQCPVGWGSGREMSSV